ncbi:hypothetical protein H5410_056522 [Solanum commersonii]|uniref:Uncharacterized protein n=1 Tax=Solanum commersonii TaxID=4109 RepID=A0A9J5WMH7_SOLCO|nr:hypothetical protein H5410_056522 [Solanum commersonii]
MTVSIESVRWVNQPIFMAKQSPERVNTPFYPFSCAIVHELFGESNFRRHLCRNFSWMSVKTLAMELIGPNGQTRPFSSSNEPNTVNGSFSELDFQHHFGDIFLGCSSRPKLWSQLVPMGKPTHFQGQTIPGAVHESFDDLDFRRYFGKTMSWTSIKTLAMELIGPDRLTILFSRSNEHRNRPKLWSLLVPMGKPAHFQGQTSPVVRRPPVLPIFMCLVHGSFGDSDFRCHFCQKISLTSAKAIAMVSVGPDKKTDLLFITHFCQKISWTSIKTLSVEPIGPDRPKGQFSRSNDPLIGFLTSFLPKIFVDICQDLKYGTSWPRWVNQPFSWSNNPRSRFSTSLLSKNFVEVPQDLSYGDGWSRRSMDLLVIRISDVIFAKKFCGYIRYRDDFFRWENQPIFKVKQTQEQVNQPIFKVKRSPERFSWMSVKTLAMEPIVLGRQTGPLSRSKEPQSGPQIWSRLVSTGKLAQFQGQMNPGTFVMDLYSLDGKIGPFSRSNKSQSALTPYFWDFHFLYEVGWSRWEKRPIFKVKQIPMQSMDRLVICISDVIFTKLFMEIHQDFRFFVDWSRQVNQYIFKVKRSPEMSMDLLVIPIFDAIFAKIFHGRPSRPYLWSQLVRMGKPTNFQGQTVPKVDLIFGASWPRKVNQAIFKVKRSPERVSWTSVKTLAMELVVLDRQIGPLSRSKEPRSGKFLWTSVKTLVMELVGPNKETCLFSWSNDPRIHGSFGDPYFRCHFCQKKLWTSVETLALEFVGPHRSTSPFSRSNDPRSGPWIFWSFSTSFLLKFFMDVRQDLKNVVGCTRRVKQPIVKASLKTLSMELVGPDGKTDPFSRSNNPQGRYTPRFVDFQTLVLEPIGPVRSTSPFSRSNDPRSGPWIFWSSKFSTSFLLKVFVDVRQDLSYGAGWFCQANRPIVKIKGTPEWVNPPFCKFLCGIVNGSYGDLDFSCHFCQKFSWTSVKTSDMKPIGPDGQTGPFSKSNEPRSGFPTSFWQKNLWTSIKTLVMELVGPDKETCLFSWSNDTRIHGNFGDPDFRLHFCQNILGKSVRTLFMESSMDILMIQISDVIFAKKIYGRSSRLYLWSRLVPIGQPAHFQGQTIPRAAHGSLGDPNFRPYFCQKKSWMSVDWSRRENRPIYKVKQSPKSFGDPDFRCHFCQIFSWTSVKTLALEPVGPVKSTSPFSRSNDPRSGPWIFWSSKFLTSFLPKVSWTSVMTLAMEPIGLERKTSPLSRSKEPRSGIYGRPPRPQIWSRLVPTGKSGHFQGQVNPRTLVMEPIGPDKKIGPFTWSNDPRSGADCFRWVNQSIFKVKRAPEQTFAMELVSLDGKTYPFSRSNKPRSTLTPRFSMDLLVIPISDFIFAKIFWGRPSRLYLWSQCVSMGKPTNFQGQTSLDAVHGSFGDSDFRCRFCKTFSWKSIKTLALEWALAMELVGPDGKTNPFSWSNEPRSRKLLWTSINTLAMELISPVGYFGDPDFRSYFCQKFSWTSIKTFAMKPIGPDGKIDPFCGFLMSFLPNYFVDVSQDLRYGADRFR